MKNDWRNNQLPPPEGTEDRADGFIAVMVVAFVLVAPLIYFGPQLRVFETWLVDVYRMIDSWVAPIRELVFG